MPTTTTTTILLPLLFFSFTLRPLSSTSAVHHRRILHQPLFPQDSSPPSQPPIPSSPKYPFTPSPDNSPFFPSYPSPPSPPSPASFATVPANISSLTVPHPSKPTSSSSKLILAAVAAVIAAIAVVSLAVFLHLRKRARTHGSPSFNKSKTQRSDSSTTISFNQLPPNTHHIPKLQRPSQTSSEFLYLGTLVNSHGIGGATTFNGSSTSTTNYINASNSRKMESPELRPLPPLNTQQGFTHNAKVVVSSKDDESEEFYSPKGSINGKESSIGTRSDSASAFAAVEVGDFNGSTSNSSSTYSSSSPRNSGPKSPDLIEIHTVAPVPSRQETRGLLLEESASPSPPSSCSADRYSTSEESSPRISNVSDQNVESPERISSPVPHNTTVIPTPPEIRGLVFPESASSSSSPGRHSRRSEESSPRILNASGENVGTPVSSSQAQHNTIINPAQPEIQGLVFQELLPRYSDQNVESPVRISSPQHNVCVSPTSLEMQGLMCLEFALPLSPNSRRSEESSPRISNVSDQNVDSLVGISSSVQHILPLPMSSLLLERYSRSEECSPRTSNASNVESPLEISGPVQHNTTVIPTPPPPPPPPPPLSKVNRSPRTLAQTARKPVEPPALRKPLRPITVENPTMVSPIELPSNDSQTVKSDGDKEPSNKETECSSEDEEQSEESTLKPKLKPLHWDKVRASSDREMVWDQLKCSSFKLNEEMIETLFIVNAPNPSPKETTRWQVLPSPGQDNGDRVLDPKKAQNIAILLKALHVTADEVCEGLVEGNADILGTELLESLLRMAPSKEEERKLREYKDDSPTKLGAAERFLKAVVDIPYAFKRVDAMLYLSNFESEVEYLKKSFATLEAACEELRTSRMFLKLLEAVLKTGNRMNVGTNRGDAHAFKLDTLLKLVDVKGADGKTTLLHFVVQEIIKSEGARLSGGSPNENSINDDAKCRKLGLQVVSTLSSELSNVKKAAVMDADVLNSDVSKLSKGIGNVREIVTLTEAFYSEESDSYKFSDSMNSFIKKAEEEIFRIQAQESVALSLVKEITEYFHGNSAREEAHPFRIFLVVRDFLTNLDRVCKEVGMVNERTMVSSAHKFPVPVNPMLQQASGLFHKRQYTSSDDESLPLNV